MTVSKDCTITKLNGDIFTDEEQGELDVGKDDTKISSDKKTITLKNNQDFESISKYFEFPSVAHQGIVFDDGGAYEYNHCDVKLFEGDEILRILVIYNEETNISGANFCETFDYKKAKLGFETF